MSMHSFDTVSRAFYILRYIAGIEESGFNEVRQFLDNASPTTVSNTLKSLVNAGLLRKNGAGRYCIGRELEGLAGLITGSLSSGDVLRPFVNELSDRTGSSALYVEKEKDRMVFRVKHDREGGLHHGPEGKSMPILGQGFGLPLIAFEPVKIYTEIIAEHTRNTGEKKGVFTDCVKQLQDEGVLKRHEVFGSFSGGCWRVAAPVRKDGAVIGSLGVSLFAFPEIEKEIEGIGKTVKETADRASKAVSKT